ncbi:flavin reductase family protein [Pelagibacterium sp. H642]|uniref:flavin reductase family protein n=1 Tax=Pelagibacterium sp. H642 TaxID=1881069 RepID=UPI002814CB96|nr:flavin reductase family protein [Pelagibacterium sp. H642]WMT89221.1 flavin reductase family protein [Pelagibacterium sp. H642]
MNMHFMPVAEAGFKSAMANLAGAVSVVTTLSGSTRLGMTASSVTSFSAQPPCIAVNINMATRTGRAMRTGSPLCVNILGDQQDEIAAIFAWRADAAGDRFSAGRWHMMSSGAPALEDAIANIDCIVEDVIERHTHAIVLARVIAIASGSERRPLLYWQRGFHSLQT